MRNSDLDGTEGSTAKKSPVGDFLAVCIHFNSETSNHKCIKFTNLCVIMLCHMTGNNVPEVPVAFTSKEED